MIILFILDFFCAEKKWRLRTGRNCSTLYEKCKMGGRPIWKIRRTSKSCTAEVFLTFPRQFYVTALMNWRRRVVTGGVGPQISECQAVVSCGHTCFDHRTYMMTSAKGQWCCQGSQSFGNGPKIPPHFYPNEWFFYFVNHWVTEFYFQKCFLTNDEACTKYNFSLLLER